MPAPVTTSPAHAASSNTVQKPHPPTKTKKSRAIRRRGRARAGIESDDEIERALPSDSDTDSDASLSPDSATDSEGESASEDELPDRHVDTHTPNTSHSSGGLDKDAAVIEKSADAFFSTSGNWSEMVADENANGAAELPVIEFSDFKADILPVAHNLQKKARKTNKKKAPTPDKYSDPSTLPKPTASEPVNDEIEAPPLSHAEDKDISRRQSHPKRPVGQSARQAYQNRLENDPSFVPKVGGFWGHDDRLMDKDLRSLSGWWRGRWQGRGRGGRGGIPSGNGRRGSHVEDLDLEPDSLPPIERTWGHDGFEEMKRKEEQRSETHSHRQTASTLRGVVRGRGGVPAIRGGRGGLSRGGFVSSGGRASAAAKAGRVWYTMKPEHMWTKQSENFLFFEPKHRGTGAAYRIQLPGSQSQVVKPLPAVVRHTSEPDHVSTGTASVVGSDIGDKCAVVKLPNINEKSSATSDEANLDDIFKVRPHLVSVDPIPLPAPSNTKSSPADRLTNLSQTPSTGDPDSSVRAQLARLDPEPPSADPNRLEETRQAVLRDPETELPDESIKSPVPENASRRPSLPPIQTVYSPPPAQPSPAYPASYGYPALPPGIALNQHGIPYEMATGHPIFIPATAPSPMYNPRPIMHSHHPQQSISYMTPPHVHPSSTMSPDFTAHQPPSHSHTPSGGVPVNGFIDPTTGMPIFAPPRPSARIEIRAPGESSNKPSAKSPSATSHTGRNASHVQTSSVSYGSSPSHPGMDYIYPSYSSSSDVSTLPSYTSLENGASVEAGPSSTSQPMVHYPAYQHYYYPNPAYGYPQYVDVSQVDQYEMYAPMDGTGYY